MGVKIKKLVQYGKAFTKTKISSKNICTYKKTHLTCPTVFLL